MARGKVSRERVERGITKITRSYPDGREIVKFQIRYGDGSGNSPSKTFSTKAKARAALARARTQIMDGDHISTGSSDTKFLKVAEDWLASHPAWKAKTRAANEGDLRRALRLLHDKRPT